MIRVLQSVAAPSDSIKYIDQVVRYAPSDVEFVYFSWRVALFGRYDLMHVHWPEYFTRGGSATAGRMKRMLLRVLLDRIRRRQIPIVRTVHNVDPHAKGDETERALLRRLDEMTTIDVTLNTCTRDRGIPQIMIPHGDYREQFGIEPKAAPNTGRLLFVGRIEEYKGVLDLIRVVMSMEKHQVHLRIVGSPSDSMRQAITFAIDSAAGASPQISAELAFVSDETLVAEITTAELVVLPYREMHNSGILLVVLSLGRPALVPSSCVNDAIAQEVGQSWVVQYDGELSDRTIIEALELTRQQGGEAPSFVGRSWPQVAVAYAAAYREALRIRGR